MNGFNRTFLLIFYVPSFIASKPFAFNVSDKICSTLRVLAFGGNLLIYIFKNYIFSAVFSLFVIHSFHIVIMNIVMEDRRRQ